MKVILTQEVPNLGDEGQVVAVKDGFGRNYLIPRGMARLATAGAIRAIEEERKQASRKLSQKKDDAKRLADELTKIDLVLTARVGEEDRIFGSITSAQIVEAMAAHGVTLDRRKVELDEEVRVLGVYTATVKLHPEVNGQIKFRVEPENRPAVD